MDHLKNSDIGKFDILVQTFNSFGISRRKQIELFKILSAILHIGNLEFCINSNTTTIKNSSQLELISSLLGIDSSSLQHTLLNKTLKTFLKYDNLSGINVSKELSVEDAYIQRDSLAHALFSISNIWIVNQINEKLCLNDDDYEQFIRYVFIFIDIVYWMFLDGKSLIKALLTTFLSIIQIQN